MAYRVLLGVADPGVIDDFRALAPETGEIEVAGVLPTAGEVVAALTAGAGEVDVVVLHEDLGPLPVLDLARNLGGRAPDIGLVLLAREHSPSLTMAALRAGFRGIVTLPLSLEDLQTTVTDAGAWAQNLRAKFERGGDDAISTAEGRMLVVAGAKGGVGTTTVAVHLALEVVRSSPDRSVCLVDFDLQKGDVRSYLDLSHRRSVADLVDVAHDLSGRQIDDSLSIHGGRLRVLLPPAEGEFADAVAGEAARRILGGVRARFDVVIVDVGAVVSEGAAVATEMADQVVMVVTPDVPSLRAANRLLGLWERLQIRKEGVGVLVNRASRRSEIQPDLVARVVSATPLKSSLPADFKSLEAAGNTGVPERLADGKLRRAIEQLARELQVVPSAARRTRRGLAGDDGQVAAETAGMVFTIGIVLLALWQLLLAGYTVVLANHAAREAARELAAAEVGDDDLPGRLEAIARADLPRGWDVPGGVDVEVGHDRVAVTLSVPAFLPSVTSSLRLTGEAGTLRERAPTRPSASPTPSPSPPVT